MQCTEDQKKILDGKQGTLKQKTLEVILKYAKALGTDELLPVAKASLFCGAHGYTKAMKTQNLDALISEMCFCSEPINIQDQKMGCPCRSEVAPFDREHPEQCGITGGDIADNDAVMEIFKGSGVSLDGSCIPYLTGFVPLQGEVFVCCESHAVLVMNSIWGARGNVNGLEMTFCSAACGYTPKFGMHIEKNRAGDHVFEINAAINSRSKWDLLGYTIGRHLEAGSVPVLTGNIPRPNIQDIKACYSAIATSGGAEMAHIVGITPEAPTLESALQNKKPRRVTVIGDKELLQTLEMLSDIGDSGEVDYISFGCPHYSLEEIAYVAELLRGKKIARGVTLHVWTSPSIRFMAERSGYRSAIETAGGYLMAESCPTTFSVFPQKYGRIVFDSCRQIHSCRPSSPAKMHYASVETCVQAAIDGKI